MKSFEWGVDPIFAIDTAIAILRAENECFLSASRKKEFARQRVLKNINMIAELQKYRDDYQGYLDQCDSLEEWFKGLTSGQS